MTDDLAAIFDAMPPEVVERTGRMHALAGRLVLALVDHDADAVNSTIDEIAGYDDAPGRRPYPGPRFLTAYQAAFELGDTFGRLAAKPDVHADGSLEPARALLGDYAPAALREAALTRLDGPGKGDLDAARVLAAAAIAAGFATQTAVFPSQRNMRFTLLRQIRQYEAEAIRAPARERIDISDADAILFLGTVLPEGFPRISHNPKHRDLWEIDLLATAKIFLLDHPASTITPGHRRLFLEETTTILESILGDLDRRRREGGRITAERGAGQRTQPRRKKPRGKR